eukprot:3148720-Prymnesium_polylepis.1
MSTSSMTATAFRKTPRSATAHAVCAWSAFLSRPSCRPENDLFRRMRSTLPTRLIARDATLSSRGYCPVSSRCSSSTNLSMNALIAVGVLRTTACSSTAERNLLSSS